MGRTCYFLHPPYMLGAVNGMCVLKMNTIISVIVLKSLNETIVVTSTI